MLVSNANIKALNLHAESPKLHSSCYMAPFRLIEERCKQDSENLEGKRKDPDPPQGNSQSRECPGAQGLWGECKFWLGWHKLGLSIDVGHKCWPVGDPRAVPWMRQIWTSQPPPCLSGALSPPATADRGPWRVFKLLWWETLIPRRRAVKWPDPAPSERTTGRVLLVLVGTVNVILALRHCQFQAPTSTFLHLQPGPCQGWRMTEICRVGPQGEEEGGWQGPEGEESGSRENQVGKLEAAEASSPLACSVISWNFIGKHCTHEGCRLRIEWEGKKYCVAYCSSS